MAYENQNVYEVVRARFAELGLEGLFSNLESIWQEGFTEQDTSAILVRLSETDAYKERFKANEARKKAGLAELTPGEYIALEDSYQDLTKTAGLSRFFGADDFTKWIERDVSPMEAQTRVATAKQAADSIDPSYKRSLAEMYGVDSDGIAAYFLDPEKTTSILEQQHNAAVIKGTASNLGVNVDKDRAELINSVTSSTQEAQQGLRQVGSQKDAAKRLGELYGDSITSDDLVTEQFALEGADDVSRKKKKLASQERAAFSGSSGMTKGSLGQRKSAI